MQKDCRWYDCGQFLLIYRTPSLKAEGFYFVYNYQTYFFSCYLLKWLTSILGFVIFIKAL